MVSAVRGIFSLALVALALFGFAVAGRAQTGSGLPPPTYDFDSGTPGTQPPTSPLVAGYDFRSFRQYQVTIPVLVPLSELQAILPSGFNAIATPAGSQTGTISFLCIVDQRFERPDQGQTYGPFTGILISTNAVNTNTSPARTEILFPGFEVSGESVALNAAFGAGSARLARVKLEIEQEDGKIRFKFDVKDKELGFDVKAQAESPVGINNRAVGDPVGLPFRALNGFVPNTAFRAASQNDVLVVPATAAKAKVDAPGGRLNLPAGSLTILGVGQNITFSRNVEFFVKFESGQ